MLVVIVAVVEDVFFVRGRLVAIVHVVSERDGSRANAASVGARVRVVAAVTAGGGVGRRWGRETTCF
jgi:hypothetical protein